MQKAKKILLLNLFLLVLLFLSITIIDKPLAVFVDEIAFVKPFFYNFTLAADKITAPLSYILPLYIGLGLLFLFKSRTKKLAFVLLTSVFTLFASTPITSSMKLEFKRARPEIYLKSHGEVADFYNDQARDYSFPSGHTSFYLSFFLPAALVFRRFAPALLFIPLVIITGRVFQNDHYLSDVLCSIIIVLNISILILGLFYLLDNRWKVKEDNPTIE